jgi:hypothetical protein
MAQVMDAEALDPGSPDGWLPHPAVEVTAPQVPALAAEEHVGLRRLGRVARQVLGQGLDHHSRQGDRAAAGGALGRPQRERAIDLQELLGHRDRAPLQVDALAAQPGQLPPAQPTEGGHEDQRIVDRAKREHPYEVPSVVAVPIIDGSPDYLGWILEQTEQPA